MTMGLKQREIIGTAREIFKRIHSKPIWGYPEAVLNTFTAVKDYKYTPNKTVHITLRVPAKDETTDAWVEDCGIGFVEKYYYLENKMGYDPNTDEYKAEQMDPNNLNKMGIGLNSIAALSKTGTVEFRTVSKNREGQLLALVCTYLGNEQTWEPPQPLSPEHVLQRDASQVKTGTKVIIKDVKDFSLKAVEALLLDVFARKIGGKDNYRIFIRTTPEDKFTEIERPPNGPVICTCFEQTIGYVKNKYGVTVPVRADLHPVTKIADAKVKFLVKKIKLGIYENDFLMRGHVWCDAAEIKPDREGVIIDEYDETYRQIDEVVTRHALAQGFQRKSEDTSGDENIKGRRTWEQKMQENILRYYDKFPDDTLLPLKALRQANGLDGQPTGKLITIRKPRKKAEPQEHKCPKGQRWDAELGECVDIIHRGKKNKKHRRRTKTPKILSTEYDLSSIPQIKCLRGDREGRSQFFAELDVTTSTLWLDTHYAWVRDNDNLESASPQIVDLFTMITMLKAVPDNHDLSQKEFFAKLMEVYQK